MKRRLLALLACPACGGGLSLTDERLEGEEIMGGRLDCGGCPATYPILRGVPRFVRVDHETAAAAGADAVPVDDLEKRTAAAFGYEWTHYDEIAEHYRQQFLDWLAPVDADFFRGKAVLEGGCGKGRHSALAAEFGASDVVAVDLGEAVEAAFPNTRHLPNVHIVQADLKRPPVKPVFDYAFSIGVLHHLPVPEDGFRALASKLRPGGHISAWVYGREGNGWIVHLVSPVREKLTSRMPHGVLDRLSGLATLPVYLSTKLVYGPTGGRVLGRGLPYGPYLSYIARFPWREQRSIVFDHLVAPVAHYIARDEFAAWFERAGLEDVRIEHHNANSWRGFARRPADAA